MRETFFITRVECLNNLNTLFRQLLYEDIATLERWEIQLFAQF